MPSLSLSSSPSAVAAGIRVHKATSELLVGPDWTMNMEICDFCNNSPWLAKDVVKEVRRRLHHKNPKVQLLTLTLLETMVKNCGDYIHQHIANRKVLDEMIKTVKKKADIHVRDKILVLLDSWQEAFGGPGEKYSQYYWACDELRRCGIIFPRRPQRSAPILTPPANHPPRVAQDGFSMSPTSSKRLDHAMSSDAESLSVSILESMRNVVELLDDMLQATNPSDRTAVRDEVIADLVDRCRSNQRKLMPMLTTTKDEELLRQGLELNYSLQSVLAKHDAIALGASFPNLKKNLRSCEAKDKNTVSNVKPSTSDALVTRNQSEEEEPEDECALLSRRQSRTSSVPSESATMGATEDGASPSGGTCNALVLIDAPVPTPTPSTCNTEEQDLIDLLSIVLTTSSTSSETTQPINSAPMETNFEASFNSYIAPWAQPPSQQPAHSPHHFQSQYQNVQALLQPLSQPGYSQYSSYSHSTWEGTAYNNVQNVGSNPYGYSTSPKPMNSFLVPMHGTWQSQNGSPFQIPQCGNQPMYTTAQVTVSSGSPMQGVQLFQHFNPFQTPPALNQASVPLQGTRSLEHVNSFPERTNGTSLNGNALVTTGTSLIPGGQKPYVPSYRLFEDLNVFGSSEGQFNSGPCPSATGNPGQNGLAGRRQ